MLNKFAAVGIALICSLNLIAQDNSSSGWSIEANNIDPNNYYGITVANGIIQLKTELPKEWKSLKIKGVGIEEAKFEKK